MASCPSWLRDKQACSALPILALLMLVAVCPIFAQQQPNLLPTEIPQTKFNSGENVVPVFEGWIRNPDGTFDMVFGYFNRNYKEELVIPPGPDNMVEPGAPDRGQPTYFLPRRQARLFRVRVPKDWGQKELVWTLRVNGHAEKAYGELLPVQEINEQIMMSGGNSMNADDGNQPPSLRVAPTTAASVASALTLTATVTDDGLPKPRTPVAPRPATTTTTSSDGTIQRQRNSNAAAARPRGQTVSWFQYGGPAKVTFSPAGQIPVANGTATATARFSAPGTYTLQASASDGALSTKVLVTVTVK